MGRLTKFIVGASVGLSFCFPQMVVRAGSEKPPSGQGLVKMEPKFDNRTAEVRAAGLEVTRSRSPSEIKLTGGVEEENLALQWDDWHNAFANAVAALMIQEFSPALSLRRGLRCWYRYEVTSDKRIKLIEITKSSGNIWFDQLVRRSVQKLEGNDVLTFPQGSMRTEVSSELSIKLGGASRGALRLGDVEYRKFEPAKN
ncbi:MAG: TonB C-terminal domain-containing protein [Candidatus Obscuribacterales bacterium]|nr:TonB C-terminal domain-containing protein [Candidatus Obscuribacterales bacterium]